MSRATTFTGPALGLAFLGLFAGCAHLNQRPEVAPPPEPPAGWESPVTSPGAGAGPEWWTAFGDPGLEALIDQALEQNRDLAAAAARVDAATAQARIAGAPREPQAGLSVDGSRRRQNFIGLPIPGAQGRVLSSTTTTSGASLNISWEADLWGRLRAAEASALSVAAASEADYAAARLSLAGQTAKAWFAMGEAELQARLAAETRDSRRRTRERIERRFRLGLRPAIELRLAISNEASAEAALGGRQQQLDAARRQLRLLISEYPEGGPLNSSAPGELPVPPPTVPGGLPAELIARRPDLHASERRVSAAGFDIRQSRAALYPQLRLTGSAGRLSSELGDLLENDFSVWGLAANLLQPVFQGGRLRAGVDLAEARYRDAAERHVQAVLRAYAEVELALAAERFLGSQAEALATAVNEAGAAERLAEDRYNSGVGGYLEVLEAQRSASAARSRLLDTRRRQLEARIDLYLALGGGWSAGTDGPSSAAAISDNAPEPRPRESP